MKEKQIIESVNTLKGLACIGVVLMHCNFPGLLGKVLLYFFKFSVPAFFMISGYFLFPSSNNQINNKLSKQIRKIAKLLFFCFVFYGILDFVFRCYTNDCISPKKWLFDVFNISLLPRKVIFGTFFNGTLWYLYALIWSYIVLKRFYKVFCSKPLVWAFILIFLHIFTRLFVKSQGYDWYIANYWRSFLFWGIPFILLGFSIAKYKKNFIMMNSYLLIIVSFFCFLLQFFEYYCYKQSLDFYFSTILYSLSIFILAIKKPNKKISIFLNYVGRKLSMYIYIIHMSVISILSYTVFSFVTSPYEKPFLTLLLSICVAQLYVSISACFHRNS